MTSILSNHIAPSRFDYSSMFAPQLPSTATGAFGAESCPCSGDSYGVGTGQAQMMGAYQQMMMLQMVLAFFQRLMAFAQQQSGAASTEPGRDLGALQPQPFDAKQPTSWNPTTPAPVDGGTFPPNVERWRPLVSKYFAPQDVDKALYVIQKESSGDPNAANPNSSARGLFQHLGRLWEGRTANAGLAGADILDPEANVAMAADLLYNRGGWSHWAVVYDYGADRFKSGLPYDFTSGGQRGWDPPIA